MLHEGRTGGKWEVLELPIPAGGSILTHARGFPCSAMALIYHKLISDYKPGDFPPGRSCCG